MEKISGIIPKSQRMAAVDLSRSQPVRPGAPSYGRAVGRVTSYGNNNQLQGTANDNSVNSKSEVQAIASKILPDVIEPKQEKTDSVTFSPQAKEKLSQVLVELKLDDEELKQPLE